MEEILEKVLDLGPTIVAVASMVISVIVAIKRVKEVAESTLEENKTLKSSLSLSRKANESLSSVNNSLNSHLEGLKKEMVFNNEKIETLTNTLTAEKKSQESLKNELATIKKQLAVIIKEKK